METFDWQALRLDIERAARHHLGGSIPDEAAAARAVYQRAETALVQRSEPPLAVACGPGCGHCCVLNVAVLEPEAAAIAEHLRAASPPPGLARLRSDLADLLRATRWLDDDERLMLRRPCAFLDAAGSCSIHPVRPLLCRKVTSLDPEDCRRAIVMHPVDESPPITVDLFHQRVFAEVFLAFAAALAGLGRLERSRRLSEAVLERL